MRSLRIRAFLLLSLCLIVLLPWLFYLAAYYIENGTLRFATGLDGDAKIVGRMDEATAFIDAGTDRWDDPAWQNELTELLNPWELEVILTSAAGEKVFGSQPGSDGSSKTEERYVIMRDGERFGSVLLYVPASSVLPLHALFAGILFAMLLVAMMMRRFLLRPLEGLSEAVRRIAAGEREIELPLYKISEIGNVRDGIEVMVKGLERSARKQAELEEERRFVIAALAHDLRTPLFALRGYLDGLEQGIARTPEKVGRYLAVSKDKAAQLDRLVEELFVYSKLDYAEPEPETSNESVNVAAILRKSLDGVRPRAERKRITVIDRLAGYCVVRCDANLLERVFDNLLDNAVRHAPDGGEIVVECVRDQDGIVRFAVLDDGPGFAPAELERVFDPLYRGEASRNRSTGGTGLGLTISRRIIRKHGGDLFAVNGPEGGALLTGWLPAHNEG
jgi:signal transduction histidine kinase